jgi:hypothetical protein
MHQNNRRCVSEVALTAYLARHLEGLRPEEASMAWVLHELVRN